jgi:hypothetical protein
VSSSFATDPSCPVRASQNVKDSHWLVALVGPWSVIRAALEGGVATSRPENLDSCGCGVLLSSVPA